MVTILLATYNGADYLSELLESIKEQTDPEWQLWVRDDGSSDTTLDILQAFQNQVKQKVIITNNQPPSGSAKKNFAHLIQDAAREKSEYVMCCDQDDIWLPDKIEKVKSKMRTDIPCLVHTDLSVVSEDNQTLSESMFAMSQIPSKLTLAELIVQNNVTGCTMMMNQKLIQLITESVDSDRVIMHDYWAALAATVFGEMKVIPEATIRYRQHEENSVGAKDSRSITYLLGRLETGKKSYQAAMEQSFDQVAYFVQCFGTYMKQTGREDDLRLLQGYSDLKASTHRERVRYYRKYSIWKCGRVRKLMQWLWG